MNDIKISVIVPVYKAERQINRCVKSIVNQSYQNLEIILVDDGSPDYCPILCNEWAKKDSRIRVIHKENGGPSSTRNAGLEIYTGSYVSFVDADDYLERDAYKILLKYADEYGADLILCNYYTVDEKLSYKRCALRKKDMVKGDFLQETLLQKFSTTSWCKLISRNILDGEVKIRFESGRRYEDTLLSFKNLLLAKKIVYVGLPLYNYVSSEFSIVAKPLESDLDDLIHNVDELTNMLKGYGKDDLVDVYCVNTLIYALQLLYRIGNNNVCKKKEILSKIDNRRKNIKWRFMMSSKEWKKVLVCKLNIIDFVVKHKEVR